MRHSALTVLLFCLLASVAQAGAKAPKASALSEEGRSNVMLSQAYLESG